MINYIYIYIYICIYIYIYIYGGRCRLYKTRESRRKPIREIMWIFHRGKGIGGSWQCLTFQTSKYLEMSINQNVYNYSLIRIQLLRDAGRWRAQTVGSREPHIFEITT